MGKTNLSLTGAVNFRRAVEIPPEELWNAALLCSFVVTLPGSHIRFRDYLLSAQSLAPFKGLPRAHLNFPAAKYEIDLLPVKPSKAVPLKLGDVEWFIQLDGEAEDVRRAVEAVREGLLSGRLFPFPAEVPGMAEQYRATVQAVFTGRIA